LERDRLIRDWRRFESHDVFVQLSSFEVHPYLAEIATVLRPRGIGVTSFHEFVTRFDIFKRHSLRFWAAGGPRDTGDVISFTHADRRSGRRWWKQRRARFFTVVFRQVR
jgi:hypothetical protein